MPASPQPRIAIGPAASGDLFDRAVSAVKQAGGQPVTTGEKADAIVWLGSSDVDGLRAVLDRAPDVRWVQLPWAGVEPFATAGLFRDGRIWTCAKGSYAEPVAEHALALALAGLRHLPERLAARSWGQAKGTSLYDARVTILGGGGIARSLLQLLRPFRVEATVLRRHPGAMEGAARVVGPDDLDDVLPGRLVVFVALSYTPETHGIIDGRRLKLMDRSAWLVNVARGGHVVTEDLVDALEKAVIAGAAVDVTDPEPLPNGHPLWDLPNAIVTPHSADWPDVVNRMLADRIERNVRAFVEGRPLEGGVNADLGY